MRTTEKMRKTMFLDSKKLVHILGNALMVIALIIVFIYQSDRAYSFYWLTLGLALLGSVYYCDQYSKEGKTQLKQADENWNKKISGKGSEKLILIMVIGVFMVCSVFVLEFFFKDLTRTINSVIYTFIVMILYQILVIYFVNYRYKEISKTEKTIVNSQLKK